MNTFKAGDRVRSVNSFYIHEFPSGTLGTVKAMGVLFVHIVSDHDNHDLLVSNDEIELVTE